MSYFLAALYSEWLKIRKSKVIWMTIVAFTIAPLMAGFFMFVLKHPALAEKLGIIGAKAQIVGEANWPAYVNLHAQIIAIGGIFVFGFVTSWIFGREYTDGTVKDLLALPYSRAIIVVAKFIASLVTNIILSAYIVTLGFFIGWLIELPQWSLTTMLHGFYVLLIITILTAVLNTPVAFLASLGRGYLAPLGFVMMTLVLSQIITVAGFGEYFPWAIPTLYSGITGESMINGRGVLIIAFTSVLGFIATLYWWIYADHH